MQRLNRSMMERYEIPDRRPATLNAVQFGMGERLLAAVDRLLDDAGGIGIRAVQAGEAGLADALNAQDGMYTLIIRGETDERPVHREQVVQCLLSAIDPDADFEALNALARTPELGLAIVDTDEENAALALALAARALAERQKAGLSGLDFICLGDDAECGARARDVIARIAASWGLGAAFDAWLREKNAFAPALVESLAFACGAEEAKKLCAQMNYADALVHTAEPFLRLTVQADEAFRRRWPIPGVVYTDDIADALLLKHRVYDAGLFAMAAPGWLLGCGTLADCMRHERLRAFMGRAWVDEIIPGAPLPREKVAERVIETCGRFENAMTLNPILRAADHLLRRFERGALPIIQAWAEENFEAPRRLGFALAAMIMLYAGARANGDGVYEVARGRTTEPLRDDPEALAVFATLAHDMPPEALAYAALADREVWQGRDLRDIDGLESRVTLDLAAIQRDPGYLPGEDGE